MRLKGVDVPRGPPETVCAQGCAQTSPRDGLPACLGRASRRSNAACDARTRISGRCGQAAHVGAQRVGDDDGAVGLLVVLEDRDERAADGESRAVQRVHELRLTRFGIAPARLHAPRLKRFAVAARRDLAVLALPRQPDLEVVGLRGAEAHVAAAQRHDAIREPEPLQHGFGVADEHFELAIGVVGPRDVHELDLVELVLANHAARVLAVRSRFRAEARRVRRQAQRQPIGLDDRVAHEVRQRHLGSRNQAQLVLALEREQVRGELR